MSIDVTKKFRLYHEKYYSLKERILHLGNNTYEDFWALKNIAFEVAEGQTVGILGRNGSGKSTLLKCMSGILQPTKGKIVVRGAPGRPAWSWAPASSPSSRAGRTSS